MKHIKNILLSAFCDGEVSEAQRSAIKLHLAACAACREKVERWQVRQQILAATPLPDPSPEFVNRIARQLARIEAEKPEAPFFGKWFEGYAFPGYSFAFSLLLLFAANALHAAVEPPPTVDSIVYTEMARQAGKRPDVISGIVFEMEQMR